MPDVSKRVLISFFAGLILGGFLSVTYSKSQPAEIPGVVFYEITDRTHVEATVEYLQTPPAGGAHNPQWLACNGEVYETEVTNENAVHSLEHGAVWITYRSDVLEAELETLKTKMSGYTFMSPYDAQAGKIMLTAWGVQLTVDSASDERVDQFLAKYRQGKQTPEPGATCSVLPASV